MISRRRKYLAWALYLPVLAAVLLQVFMRIDFNDVLSLDYGLFLLLAVAVAMSPIRTENSVFTIVTGISVVAFVVFGTIPEIFISSIAFLYVLFRSDVRWDQHHRYAMNLLMVILMSSTSAGAYYLAEDYLVGISDYYYGILPIIVYMFVHILTNQLFIYVAQKYYYNMKDSTFFNGFLVLTLKIAALALPFSYILLSIYNAMGVFGIFVGAVPFMTISFGTKYYFQSRSRNAILTDVNKYARKLNEKKDVISVVEAFNIYLLKFIPSNHILLFKTTKKEDEIILKKIFSEDEVVESNQEVKVNESSLVKKALETHEIQIFSKAEECDLLITEEIDFQTESGVVLPLHIMNRNVGVVIVSHYLQAVYDEFLLSLIQLFYKYFLIVLDNANNFERLETSNITDYLTQLPNLRGFRDEMKQIEHSENYESLSVIVLDLDHFKRINDEHGHEAGNDVLEQVAEVLKQYADENTYVARYGGEEFIISLKDYGKEKAYEKAEKIREHIEKTSFVPHNSITGVKNLAIPVTASLGIATYPDDCDDLYELVNLADRVMYLESKRSGRNRVAEFLRES